MSNCFSVDLKKAGAATESIQTHAQAAALIDVTSGVVIYSKLGDKQMRIASLTKVMTAIVAIEQGDLSDSVTTSKRAAGREGSSIYLKLGEQMSLQHLLFGLMLRSGNDAATAIAEHVGGTEEGFVYLMNQKAEMLGMLNSHFMNPHGLDVKDHYSTANDMAILTAYALKNPIFQEIVQTKIKKVPNPNESWGYIWTNKNKMLSLYPGSDGVKTGYTKLSLRCLISSATRDGQQLAVVTLNDSDDWADHSRLLNYGFKNFPIGHLVDKGEPVENGLATLQAFNYPLTPEQSKLITRSVKLNDPASLSYRLGTKGILQLSLSNKIIGTVPLVTQGSPLLDKQNAQAFSFQQSIAAPEAAFVDNWHFFVHALFNL
ncbi:D-alanyl-D-alanine carboxypeptidase family protein [Paenibacillus psychroresistens]|nr:D-alanyl-D-alanine carboxypeptidase family protein [Paenibacillus psychroresistens]